LDPRFAGSNPVKDDGFLRAIKIFSTKFFRGEVKPLAQCLGYLRWHVKGACGYEQRHLVHKIWPFLARFLLLCY
jgi:hypothetical protein